MSRISGPGGQVLRSFIAAANAQYRDAGLGRYQMRLRDDGGVDLPGAAAPSFDAPSRDTGSTARDQAATGAATTGSAAQSASAAPAAARRSGSAPAISGLAPTADGFVLRWKAVTGAKRYGVWIDGALAGHVTKPEFAGALAAGSGGVVQVDAELANGARTQLTPALRLSRTSAGELQAGDGSQAAAPASATAPAAAAS